MKKISKREEKKLQKIKKENIEKFTQEIKENKKISIDYKKKIKNRILKNLIIAIISIIYLLSLNIVSFYINTNIYILLIKVICLILALISIIYFELCYRKDNGFLFLHGVEFLFLAAITLFSIYAYKIYFIIYNKILYAILLVDIIYFIIKTIYNISFMKKKYYKEQNDIKDIVMNI